MVPGAVHPQSVPVDRRGIFFHMRCAGFRVRAFRTARLHSPGLPLVSHTVVPSAGGRRVFAGSAMRGPAWDWIFATGPRPLAYSPLSPTGRGAETRGKICPSRTFGVIFNPLHLLAITDQIQWHNRGERVQRA